MITMVWNRSYHTFWYIYTSYEYSKITYHMMTNDVYISYLMRHTIQLASNISDNLIEYNNSYYYNCIQYCVCLLIENNLSYDCN